MMMDPPHWPPIGQFGTTPHSTDYPAWNIGPALHPDHNQSSNQYIHPSRDANPTYSYAAAGDRFPVPPFSSASAELEALRRLPGPFPTVPRAEPTSDRAVSSPIQLGDATAAPTAAQSNAGKRKQAPRSKSKAALEWESHKEAMYEVYMKQDKALKDLIKFMKENHQFEATPKQYKNQFNIWKWVKNLPHDRVRFMRDKASRRRQQGKRGTEFEWREQQWTEERVQKSLSKGERINGQKEILDIPTPSDVTYHTPRAAPSPGTGPPPLEQTGLGRNVRPTTTHQSTLRPIMLRWKGYTAKDLDTLRETARELDNNDDYDGAEAKYDELLEAAKYLLPAAGEATSGIAYEVAIFYAHSDNMTKADEVIDDLSSQFTQRWGFSHEKTVNHYSTIASLLTVWNRHDDAVNILKWMTDDFSTSIVGSRAGAKTKRAQSPHSGASPSVNLDNPLLGSSMPFVANSNKETSSSSALAVLQAQLNSSRTVVVDDDESADQLILDLLHRMEAKPERNVTDIARARCLLVDFYDKVGLPEESKSALQAAKHSIQSLCQLECRMPIEFFDVSIGLAEILLSDGDATNGEQLLERIETKFVQAYGESHTDTISLLIRIGKMYQRLKRWEDAEPRFEQAYAACITELGHNSTVTKNLERCLEKKHYSSSLELDDETQVCPVIML